MAHPNGEYGIFTWDDEKGSNKVTGMREGNKVLGLGGTSIGQQVVLPDGTMVFQPQSPKMVHIGVIIDGDLVRF